MSRKNNLFFALAVKKHFDYCFRFYIHRYNGVTCFLKNVVIMIKSNK